LVIASCSAFYLPLLECGGVGHFEEVMAMPAETETAGE